MTQTKICTTQKDFFHAVYLRSRIFVGEQKVDPLIEIDEKDADATHIISYDGEKPVATCRILWEPHDEFATLGRLCVLPGYRHTGIGSEVLAFAEDTVRSQGVKELRVHAQVHAEQFYAQNGYTPYGERFVEAGIWHVSMKKEV